jgi:molybdopterin-containing oxidoreductase family iron-sulfur binding subunit
MRRRDFLRFLGWVSGSTAITSCTAERRPESLMSYLTPPEEGVVPGVARTFPSTCTECPAGCGILATVREWPFKLEGLPGHPVSDGGLCVRGQASLSRLYHPDRIRYPLARSGGRHVRVSWEKALSRVTEAAAASRKEGRRNLFLSGRTTGSLSRLIDSFCDRLPADRLPEFEVYFHGAVREANALLFGVRDVPHYRIDDADFLLTVGADVLETHVTPIAYTRMISRARSRGDFLWYHVEPHFSLTGADASRRFAVAPGREPVLLSFLLGEVVRKRPRALGIPRELAEAFAPLTAEQASAETGIPAGDLAEIGERLAAANRPLPLFGGVSAGGPQGRSAAAAAALLQWAAGAFPERVDFARAENYERVGSFADMEKMSARMGRGEAGVVFVHRTNPVFALPQRFTFRENLGKAALSVGLGDFLDETMREADVVLPLSHSLESWGDAEPRRGVVSLVQPVVRPLHATLSDGDALLRLLAATGGSVPAKTYEEYLRAAWAKRLGEAGQSRLLAEGYVEEAPPARPVSLKGGKAAVALRGISRSTEPGTPVLVLAPSLRTFDGRSRPLPLLSEIPDPVTTVSYGPWISVPPATAARSGIRDRDEVTVSASGLRVALPAVIQAGLPEGVFVVHRDAVASPPVETDADTGSPIDLLGGVSIARSGRRAALPVLSGSRSQHGRGIIPDRARFDEIRHEKVESLYPDHVHEEYRWAMAIDLALCNGCSACVAACYIENNVPVVGKSDHLNGREMSWLRIEPYYGEGRAEFLPMLCQQCHYAPCETVCPVFAAYHNPEGLNIQVYARCVGTRYCSNNCPYKVRRFNWFTYEHPYPLNLQLNPDVTVRQKGVMEKCTFCVQRINRARLDAKAESRKVRDGEFTTACAQSCPTGAIVFGNLLDPDARVSRLSRSSRTYRVFQELGTVPSVYYLRGRDIGDGK